MFVFPFVCLDSGHAHVGTYLCIGHTSNLYAHVGTYLYNRDVPTESLPENTSMPEENDVPEDAGQFSTSS